MSDVIKFEDKDGKVVYELKEKDTEPKKIEIIMEGTGTVSPPKSDPTDDA